MEFKIKKLKFLTGRPVCMIHESTAKDISVHVGDRVSIKKYNREIISVVDLVDEIIKPSEIALSEEIIENLSLKNGDYVNVEIAEHPRSISLIKNKLKGEVLSGSEIREIITDIANNALTEVEVAFFVSAVYTKGMNLNETKNLIKAMVETGKRIKLKGKIADKHCIGGIAGNRTTPIVVSICAAAGLIIPKTSSRAITSAAGTADTIETIARVEFSIKEIERIVKKTNACLVWGGALGLAPVDDKIIKVERVVNLDSTPQLLASILSKKISVGSHYILIDIPFGRSAKVSRRKADELKEKFIKIGNLFNLKIGVVLTDGSEPIGNGIGPVLEIKDVLKVLRMDSDSPEDLKEKSLVLAGRLLELTGKSPKGKGIVLARKILESGKAFEKFKQIIQAQEGKIDGFSEPKYSFPVKSERRVRILHYDNHLINKIARFAGCPEDKEAGVYLNKKKNETVEKGDTLFIIYATSREKLELAKNLYNKLKNQVVKFKNV